jgi:hypothetical protein
VQSRHDGAAAFLALDKSASTKLRQAGFLGRLRPGPSIESAAEGPLGGLTQQY